MAVEEGRGQGRKSVPTRTRSPIELLLPLQLGRMTVPARALTVKKTRRDHITHLTGPGKTGGLTKANLLSG